MGHLDNVAASTNGGFNIIAKNSLGEYKINYFIPNEKLGLAIGYSDYKKEGGTEALRKILNRPIRKDIYVENLGRISSATLALVNGDIDGFIEMIWEERFHELRRANIGAYGFFNFKELLELKRYLFDTFGVALNISGAGPNIQIVYNKEKMRNWEELKNYVEAWFLKKKVKINIKKVNIAKEGAYDKALRLTSKLL
ncbi:Homoserine kinase [archaeon HR06]|nr:Homoserine kinase [archaeon HR06]